MRAAQDDSAITEFRENNGCISITSIDINIFIVGSQDLNLVAADCLCINKDSTSVKVRYDLVRDLASEKLRFSPEPDCPRATLSTVLKALESTASARAWEEAKLAAPNHLHPLVSNLKFASTAAIIRPGTESQERTPSADIIADAPVALAIEDPAVAEVGTARYHQQGTGGSPWFFENDGFIDGNDCIIGR